MLISFLFSFPFIHLSFSGHYFGSSYIRTPIYQRAINHTHFSSIFKPIYKFCNIPILFRVLYELEFLQ